MRFYIILNVQNGIPNSHEYPIVYAYDVGGSALHRNGADNALYIASMHMIQPKVV